MLPINLQSRESWSMPGYWCIDENLINILPIGQRTLPSS